MTDARELQQAAELIAGRAAEFVITSRATKAGASPWRGAETRSSATDYVTALDRGSEQVVRVQVAKQRPGDAVLGEEGGGTFAGQGEVTWVVDPVNGTTNLKYGFPAYAVSVAALIDGISVAGAVAEPHSGRLWSAGLGEGARLHDPRLSSNWLEIRVGATQELSQCLLATGFSYDPRERAEQGAVIARLVGRINDVRRPGCAALDLCHVAAGWVDAYVQHGLNLWDWAAGALIAEEAGAVVHWPGTPGPAATIGDPVFASAPGIAADLIDALAAAGASSLRAANSAMVRALPSVLPPQTA